MFKDFLKNIKTAVQNDLKTSYLAKNPSVIGNVLMGEPWNANTKWGKPKKYEQQPFKLSDGTMWIPPEMKKKQNDATLKKATKYAPEANPLLNVLQAVQSGGLKMGNQKVSSPKVSVKGAKTTPTPTVTPTPTQVPYVPPNFEETLNTYIFPNTRPEGIPDALSAGQTAYESGRGTSEAARNLNNYHGIMQWNEKGERSLRPFDSASDSAKMYAKTVKNILKKKGYNIKGMTADQILEALQTGTPRYEGDNADPMHYVNYMKSLNEYQKYNN